MADKFFMTIDAGTGSVRAVIFDTKGNQIGCAQKEWYHSEDSKYPGSMNFDWNTNWELARSCIKEVLKSTAIKNTSIAAISTTCMREGIVLYDKDGKEIWACANVDARSNDEVLQLKKLSQSLEKELYLESGQTYSLSAIPRLLWVKNKEPEIYKKIAYVGMFNDWLIYKLSGSLIMEPSNGSTSGLFSLKTRTFDKTIAERCNLRSDIFPPVQECGTIAGKVNKKGAEDTGLHEGTTIVIGGGDAQLGTLGVGVTEDGEAAVFGGSFWQYEFNTINADLSDDCNVRVNCYVQSDLMQYEALAFKPGLVMRWFRDAFCMDEKQTDKDVYPTMDAHAKKIPAGCYGMQCTFSDVMNFMSWRHAAPTFTNFDLDPEKFNKYTFYRAILENTALITYGHIELVFNTTGKKPEKITFAGGASKSALWSQILCDVIGMPVQIPVVKEATALGAAILSATADGTYKSLKDAAKNMVKIEKTYTPNMDNHKKYMEMYAQWRSIYKAQLELSDQKITRHMWSAPGL